MKNTTESNIRRETIVVCNQDITDITVPFYVSYTESFKKDEELWVSSFMNDGSIHVCIGQGDYVTLPPGSWRKVLKITETKTKIIYQEISPSEDLKHEES